MIAIEIMAQTFVANDFHFFVNAHPVHRPVLSAYEG
jgi:hypothetical protein